MDKRLKRLEKGVETMVDAVLEIKKILQLKAERTDYYRDPREVYNERQREYYARTIEDRHAWADANRERLRANGRKSDAKRRALGINQKRQKEWVEANRERVRENARNYYWGEGNKKCRISSWKHMGLIDDYDYVYDRFESTLFCDFCLCDLDQCTKSVKSMDHCHETGKFRNILCLSCNVKRK